jgi:hypothetical protein
MLVVMLVVGSGTAKGFWGQHLGDLFLVCGNVCWATVACLIATLRTIRQRAADPALLSTVAEIDCTRGLQKAA